MRLTALLGMLALLGCSGGWHVLLAPPTERFVISDLAAATTRATGVPVDSIIRDSTTLEIWNTFPTDSGWIEAGTRIVRYAFTHDASPQPATCIRWQAEHRGFSGWSFGIAWLRVTKLGNGAFLLRGTSQGPSLSQYCYVPPVTGVWTTSSISAAGRALWAPNKRLELAGRTGQGAVDRLMTWEAAVETFNSLLPARRPQLKRGR